MFAFPAIGNRTLYSSYYRCFLVCWNIKGVDLGCSNSDSSIPTWVTREDKGSDKLYCGRKGNIRYSERKMEKGEEKKILPCGHYVSTLFLFCEIGRCNVCLQQPFLFFLDLWQQEQLLPAPCRQLVWLGKLWSYDWEGHLALNVRHCFDSQRLFCLLQMLKILFCSFWLKCENIYDWLYLPV